MCGITGFITSQENSPDLDLMIKSLTHRGPDAKGAYLSPDGKTGLGHRRLSIIDTHPRSNQPLQSHCKRYLITFNGEIYNFKELRDEILNIKSIHFRTTSDTEVLVEAFALWGYSFVDRLNGMFAIVIYDLEDKKTWLFRDRLGIKPLLLFQKNEIVAWSSEIKTFQNIPPINKNLTINLQTINFYLHLGYVPEPHTIYHEVEKFPAGGWGCFDQDLNYSSGIYWNIQNKISSKINHTADPKVTLTSLIESSVRYRMISDVPFGTLLSGGVDSSLVTAIASKLADKPLKTFTIGLKDQSFDESPHARQVASHLKTEHYEYMVTERDTLDLVKELIHTWDEPFADSSAVPTMVISQLARQEVKMVLSGDGGDELFHGYGAYTWANRLSQPHIKLFGPIIGKFLRFSFSSRHNRAAHLFDNVQPNQLRSHIFSQEQYLFSASELKKLMSVQQKDFVYLDPDLKRSLSPSEKQALFDLNYYLKDDLLVKVDRASMKFGLEDRVPFLDHRLVELVINLTAEMKIKNGDRKYLLKQILYKYLPEKLFDRPKKGFSIPLVKWLKNDLKDWMNGQLEKEVINHFGLVHYEEVKKLKHQFFGGRAYLYNRLWSLAILHHWMQEKT